MYTHTHTHIYTHTSTHRHKHKHTYTHRHTHTQAHTLTQTQTSIHTGLAIEKLPFSFCSVPYHRNRNDHETVQIRCPTCTFCTVHFHSYHLICTRNSHACAVRAYGVRLCKHKLVKYWLHVCGILWGLPKLCSRTLEQYNLDFIRLSLVQYQ